MTSTQVSLAVLFGIRSQSGFTCAVRLCTKPIGCHLRSSACDANCGAFVKHVTVGPKRLRLRLEEVDWAVGVRDLAHGSSTMWLKNLTLQHNLIIT